MSEINRDELELESTGKTPKFNHLQRYIGVIVKPREVLEDISDHPRVLIPMFVMAILLSAIMLINMDAIIEVQRQAMMEQSIAMGNQVPLDGFESLSKNIAKMTVAIAGVGAVAVMAIVALITHGIATFISGEGTFKKVFSASLYIAIVTMLGSALAALLSLVLPININSFSPAILMDPTQVKNPLFIILSSIEVFNLWRLALMAIALSIIESFTIKKSVILIIVLAVLGILVQMISLAR